MTNELEQHLQKAVAFHGHLCAGQVIGVRIAMLGLRLLGLSDPYGADRKKLMVIVEIGRCATDALMTVSGARVGRRTMQVIDNGKMAATFLNIENGQAVRIASRWNSQDKAIALYPQLSAKEAQIKGYKEMPDEDMFDIQQVAVQLPGEDMPGLPHAKVPCSRCGEMVLDMRHVQRDDQSLCKSCAGGKAYYTVHSPIRV